MITIQKMKSVPSQINYYITRHELGSLFVSTTDVGICNISFIDDEHTTFQNIQSQYPKTHFVEIQPELTFNPNNIYSLCLHVIGTDFQLSVWNALLNIPFGRTTFYQDIAHSIGREKAVRAVGSAIAKNPVALLIPCHRVVRKTNDIGNYRWGITRKKKLIETELLASTINATNE